MQSFSLPLYTFYPNNYQYNILFHFLVSRLKHFGDVINCEHTPTQKHPLLNIWWALQLYLFVCLFQFYPKLLIILQWTKSSNLRLFFFFQDSHNVAKTLNWRCSSKLLKYSFLSKIHIKIKLLHAFSTFNLLFLESCNQTYGSVSDAQIWACCFLTIV